MAQTIHLSQVGHQAAALRETAAEGERDADEVVVFTDRARLAER